MERKEGCGRPEAPTSKEQGRGQRERTANKSLASPIEQKPSDQLSPISTREKKIDKAGTLSKMRGKIGDRRSTCDCILFKSTFSPFDIQRKYEHVITKEQALEEGQVWVESLKTKDRQELRKMLESLERFKRERFSRLRDKYQTPQQTELLEYEIEAIREQLRQRGG